MPGKYNHYKAEWDKTHTKEFKMKLNLNTDADIIAKLDSLDNKQGYIKKLIREDIAKGEKK